MLASHDRLRVVDDIQAEDEHTREEVQLSHVLARTTVQLTARREPTSVAEHTRKKAGAGAHYPIPMTQPKMMSVNNAANRYDPMPVKSILVWQANTLRPMVMAAVMPAATRIICASEKAQYVANMNPSATVKVDSTASNGRRMIVTPSCEERSRGVQGALTDVIVWVAAPQTLDAADEHDEGGEGHDEARVVQRVHQRRRFRHVVAVAHLGGKAHAARAFVRRVLSGERIGARLKPPGDRVEPAVRGQALHLLLRQAVDARDLVALLHHVVDRLRLEDADEAEGHSNLHREDTVHLAHEPLAQHRLHVRSARDRGRLDEPRRRPGSRPRRSLLLGARLNLERIGRLGLRRRQHLRAVRRFGLVAGGQPRDGGRHGLCAVSARPAKRTAVQPHVAIDTAACQQLCLLQLQVQARARQI